MEITKKQFESLATKDELKKLATKDELKKLATKDELKKLATKKDLLTMATKKDLEKLSAENKAEISSIKKEMKKMATKDEVLAVKDELKEEIKKELSNFYTKTELDKKFEILINLYYDIKAENTGIRKDLVEFKNEILDAIDKIVKKHDNFEQELVANQAAHDRFEKNFVKIRKHVGLRV